MYKNATIENDTKTITETDTSNYTPFTLNEIKNVIGENYVTTAKRVKALAVKYNLRVGEKFINNRPVTTYYLGTKELTELKNTFANIKLQNQEKSKNDINAVATNNINDNFQNNESAISIKYCKLVEDNSELQKRYDTLEKEYQRQTNELTITNADLTVAQNNLKFIEVNRQDVISAKAKIEQEYNQYKIDREEKLFQKEKEIRKKDVIIYSLVTALFVVLTAVITAFIVKYII